MNGDAAARLRAAPRTARRLHEQAGRAARRRSRSSARSVQHGRRWARFLDTFTNTTGAPLTIEVAFGGQLGLQHGHQPERDRRHLQRRRALTPPTTGSGRSTPPSRGRRLGHRQRHERDRHRHVRPHRQLPARPVHVRAARRRATRPTTSATSTRSRSPPGETKSLVRFVVDRPERRRARSGGTHRPAAGTQVAPSREAPRAGRGAAARRPRPGGGCARWSTVEPRGHRLRRRPPGAHALGPDRR